MKKLVIFDFDGTLFDSIWDVETCFNRALGIHGFPTLAHEEYIEKLGGNIDEAVSLILKDQNTSENIEIIKAEYARLYGKSKKENTLPFPGSLECLRLLQEKGILFAINSNRSTDSVLNFADEFFTDIDFLAIEGHNPDYPSKPAPYGVNNIIEKANVSLDEALYIGDSKTDIKTARNAGIDCVIVRWGYGDDGDYCNEYPVKVIDDFSQLNEFF